MSEDKIRYDILASEALRGIIRTVMQRVQKRGLPGEHHFYINFDTCAAGTILSKRLKAQYPEEMTIVLQHKFWDLLVYDDRFEVKLSFNNVPERLVIPYSSIKSFVDPSVPFGFNPNLFTPLGRPAEDIPAAPPELPADRTALPGPQAQPETLVVVETLKPERDPPIRQEEQPEQGGAKVVELDLFRKK
ncbi:MULTISPECIES: ClpXP protease specificity-enhancing factor SspB [Rhodomicrobium]|uniref:SspB family protein n=1 Tax=Rhodomicrobium TaxID=1068 RepID=UPI000B4B88E0|nr:MULTISPECIES: ClpXP protease specificity-enhancing factor SspB [Rhodomicrobium]